MSLSLESLKKLYWSESAKHIIGSPRRLLVYVVQHFNKPIFSIEIQATAGFFSVLQSVLFILQYCKEEGLVPIISVRGGAYGDVDGRQNWLRWYFDYNQTVPADLEGRAAKAIASKIKSIAQLGLRQRFEHQFEIEAAGELFSDWFRPTAAIRSSVEQIAREQNISSRTLGVHYRGSDKIYEAERVDWHSVVAKVDEKLIENPQIENIFLATDENEFLQFFSAQTFRCPVVLSPAVHFAKDGRPPHFSGIQGYDLGCEALTACLTLAQCGWLIKTPSYLSGWAKIFNPQLQVELISPPRPDAFWFPDSVLWRAQQEHAV